MVMVLSTKAEIMRASSWQKKIEKLHAESSSFCMNKIGSYSGAGCSSFSYIVANNLTTNLKCPATGLHNLKKLNPHGWDIS